MRRKPSLRVAIGVAIGFMVVLTAGSITLRTWFSGKDNAEEVMVAMTRMAAEETEQKILGFLARAQKSTELVAQRLASGGVDPGDFDAMESLFFDLMVAEGTLSSVNWGSTAGDFVMVKRLKGGLHTKTIDTRSGKRVVRWKRRAKGAPIGAVTRRAEDPKDVFDPRVRPWYGGAIKARGLHWTDVYVFHTDKAPGITVSAPVIVDGAVTGVACIDIALDELTAFLTALVVADSGRAVVLERNGDLVSGPQAGDLIKAVGDRLVVRPASESAMPSLSRLASAGEFADALKTPLGETRILRYDVGDAPYIGSLSPVRIGGSREWVIGILVPESDFLATLREANRRNVWISLGLLLGALLLAVVLTRFLSASLIELVAETEDIRDLRFSEKAADRSPFLEITRVFSAFEDMKVGLRSFQKYLPLNLVRQLLAEAREPTLGGQFKELTIYFSDIVDFTPINEGMHPMDMAVRLGQYLSAMSRKIEDESGTVVQYVGDEIMAFWGAPLDVEDHAVRACRAALANSQRVLKLWDELDPEADLPIFHTRFGIHTAEVAVGHFGSEERLYYGAIGDGINLTSRLEGLNKHYGTIIIVSETARAQVGAEFRFRKLDRVAVKGKEIPVEIYELLGEPATVDADPDLMSRVRRFELALDHYFAGSWTEALSRFTELHADWPTDEPTRLMAERCGVYAASPPADWRGVHRMDQK